MLSLLNAIKTNSPTFWLLVALGILLIIEVAAFAILFVRRRYLNSQQTVIVEGKRWLIGISLDTTNVRTEYAVGEKLETKGLVVKAHFSEEPLEELVNDYWVDAPQMSVEGTPTVKIYYKGMMAEYGIRIGTPHLQTSLLLSDLMDGRSLVAIALDAAAVRREYTVGEQLDITGLIVTAHYSQEPFSETVEDYTVEAPDMNTEGVHMVKVFYKEMMSEFAITVKAAAKPAAVRALMGITLNTDAVRKTYTAGDELDLTGLVVYAHYNFEPAVEEIKEGYEVLPLDMMQVGMPMVMVSYGGFTIGFQISVSPVTTVIEEAPEIIRIKHDPIVIEEESYEGGTLRYDRSFTARLIQSDDEIKHWYTEIKNYLLSFKKVKDRMSWKRESYRYGREPVVRLGYRGKTLCVFLPLDPNDYLESKYKVEDVSDNTSYIDTPCMYRIKNERRVKYAMELIDVVMERLSGGMRIERESVDYYVPYEGLVELINKGLIKRNIKSKQDEAFFEEKQKEAEVAVAAEVATTDAKN